MISKTPWMLEPVTNASAKIKSADGNLIAIIHKTHDGWLDDVHLVLRAPELLQACFLAMQCLKSTEDRVRDHCHNDIADTVFSVINKRIP
jgi:hypothetical protein